jgi:hypothetical protein
MPIPAEQPRFDQPVVDGRGLATIPWMNYWLRMASAAGQQDMSIQIDGLQRQIDELSDDQGAPTFQLVGNQSIAVQGVPISGGVVVVSLLGDVDVPGNTRYYGTDPLGQKGWFAVADTLEAQSGELTKTTGSDGVSTLGLADLANSGAGALLAITRDGKGRVSGTRAATITGTTNQINVANGTAAAGLPTLSLATAVITSLGKADSSLQSVVPGTGIAVDNTDPQNPIVSATGGSGSPTFPFILQTGASYIPLTGANELPFFLANGSASNIPVTP